VAAGGGYKQGLVVGGGGGGGVANPPTRPVTSLVVEALLLCAVLAAPSLGVQREPFDPKDEEKEEGEGGKKPPATFGTGINKITPYGSSSSSSSGGGGPSHTPPLPTTRVYYEPPPLHPFAWEAAVLITPLSTLGGEVGQAALHALGALKDHCDPYAVARLQGCWGKGAPAPSPSTSGR